MKSDYIRPQFTPERIDVLQPGEIFVFGSNLDGIHGGGAAHAAWKYFGAVWGQGEGIQGQSYAIPTMQGGPKTIRPFVNRFIEFAKSHGDLTFLVTPIGCGIAGLKVEEIAPLFSKALHIDNIVLPKAFVDHLLHNHPTLPDYLKTKMYGQACTLVDLLIELNKKNHYTSADAALNDLSEYLEDLRINGDEVAFNCSVRSIYAFAGYCFEKGYLDIKELQKYLKRSFAEGIDLIYKNYVVEKAITLVSYLNDFRRYTKPEDLRDDFITATGGVNHCGPNIENYFFSFSSVTVKHYLNYYTKQFWNEVSTNGRLDNRRFYDFMLGRHQRGIKKYGLNAVIRRNYRDDGSCHPEAYFPFRGGAGPVYVAANLYDQDLLLADRKLVNSCGDGKDLSSMCDFFEFKRILPILEKDDKYMSLGEFFIPKSDVTLPVFSKYRGRILFVSDKEHELFIKKAWSEKTN